MPVDLGLERAGNLQWRSVGMKPDRLTDAAQAVNHPFRW
jgi:hypothetical protein